MSTDPPAERDLGEFVMEVADWAEPPRVVSSTADWWVYPTGGDAAAVAAWEALELPGGSVARFEVALHLLLVVSHACGICGEQIEAELPVTHPGRVQLDHVHHRWRGGADVMGNVRPTHAHCNAVRGGGEVEPEYARESLERAAYYWAHPEEGMGDFEQRLRAVLAARSNPDSTREERILADREMRRLSTVSQRLYRRWKRERRSADNS